MSIKLKRRTLLLSAAATLTPKSLARGRRSPQGQARPDLIVVIADDMRWDAIGAAGNPIIQTPHLDALIRDGALFANNFTTTSICPASRASLFTGQYARRHDIWGFNEGLQPAQRRQSYPGLLRDAGWTTAFIGKWGLGGKPPEDLFDTWRGFSGQGSYYDSQDRHEGHLTRRLGDEALGFLERAPADRPFCLTLSFKAPHVQDDAPEPFQPDPAFAELYRDTVIPRPPASGDADFQRLPFFLRDSEARRRWRRRFAEDAQYQHSVKEYYRLIAGVDREVGRLTDALKRHGRYDNAWLLFTSDNGFFLGEHGLAGKWHGFEPSIRTPLIVKPAGGVGGQRITAMTLNIDLCPTLLDAAGLKPPATIQGRSLAPLLTGGPCQPRTHWLYEHLLPHPGIPASEGVRGTRYKYLAYRRQAAGELLFDLETDPHETHNLAGDPAMAEIVERHRRLLAQLREAAR